MIRYFDNSATTKPLEEVVEIMKNSLEENYGNPSSLHHLGLKAEKDIKKYRRIIANSLNVIAEEIYFTSGGTESNNIAIFGSVNSKKRLGNKIITSKIEHPSVLNPIKYLETQGYEVVYLDVNKNGLVDIEQFENTISEDTILVSLMHVNNEIGTIQPIKKIGDILENTYKNTNFHVDAIQSYEKLDIKPYKSNIDLLSFSGHKIHGPKGIGALYINKKCTINPLIYGGEQERTVRSGTENVPGIFGLGKAVECLHNNLEKHSEYLYELRKYFIKNIKEEISDIRINSYVDERCAPHILNISFLGIKAEILLHLLEQDNIYVSTGSACSSKKKYSHVLNALGLNNEEIEGAVRFSFSIFNTYDDIDYTIQKLKKHVSYLRKIIKR